MQADFWNNPELKAFSEKVYAKFPNAGLNTVGGKVGLTFHFNRDRDIPLHPAYRSDIPRFPRHMSYDAKRRSRLITG